MRCSSTAQTGSSCASPSASPYRAGWKHEKAQTTAPREEFILVSNISNSPVSHCIAPKHISVSVSPHRPCLLDCLFCEMHIYLIPPYLASPKCLWRQTMEIAMGGQNCCIGLASVSFPIHLNMPWCCIVAKTHTGYVYGCLRVPVSLGGICLPLTGLQALTDPNTLF